MLPFVSVLALGILISWLVDINSSNQFGNRIGVIIVKSKFFEIVN